MVDATEPHEPDLERLELKKGFWWSLDVRDCTDVCLAYGDRKVLPFNGESVT